MKKGILVGVSLLSLTVGLFAQSGTMELAEGCVYTGNYSDHCIIASTKQVATIYGCIYDNYATSNCGYYY
jgi:hypothetical protein